MKPQGAIISECGLYRYKLWRIWDESKPCVLWVMHNPSTADGIEDDNTITRIINFSKSWGYGGLFVGNLFPYRTKKPSILKAAGFEIASREENWQHIEDMAKVCSLKILAYGNPVFELPEMKKLYDDWNYLKLTKSGNPYHPLYLKSDLNPQPYIYGR